MLNADSLTSPQGRRLVPIGILMAVALLLTVLTFSPPTFFESLDEAFTDAFFYAGLGDRAAARSVVVVAIDRRTLVESGQDWPRFFPRFAEIIEILTQNGARCIAFDLGISTAQAASAQRFLQAVAKGPPFVLASTLPPERRVVAPPPQGVGERALLDSPDLHRAYVDLLTPPRETARLRRLALSTKRKGKDWTGFALTAAAMAEGLDPSKISSSKDRLTFKERSFPLEDGYFRVPYLARRGGVPQVSCADLLAGKLPKAIFENRVVLVGPADARFHDDHLTPIGRILGVQIHGNVVEALLNGKALRLPSSWVRFLFILFPLLMAYLVAKKASSWASLLTFLVLAGVIKGAALLAPSYEIWFSPLLPLLGLLIGTLIPPALRTIFGALEGLRVKRLFGQFVSKEVFATLMAERDALDLEGKEVEATLLFADIRGFTTLSARLGPKETFRILNEYLSEMVDVILAHGRRLDKFMGDGIMAVWGAPFSSDEDPWNATQAALTMIERLKLLNRHLALDGRSELRIGVGLCTGIIHAGVIGTADKMEYAVIGDTVNTASRLEHMTKDLGFPIVMAESTYRPVAHRIRAKDLGSRAVRGRKEEVRVFALMELLEDSKKGSPTKRREPPTTLPPDDSLGSLPRERG